PIAFAGESPGKGCAARPGVPDHSSNGGVSPRHRLQSTGSAGSAALLRRAPGFGASVMTFTVWKSWMVCACIAAAFGLIRNASDDAAFGKGIEWWQRFGEFHPL